MTPYTAIALQRLEELIQVQKRRLQELLSRENQSRKYIVKTSHEITLLSRLYMARLRIRKELDLEVAAAGPVIRIRTWDS